MSSPAEGPIGNGFVWQADGWSAIGTTNLDNRSFEHNDEVNLTCRDAGMAARLTRDNDDDIARSTQVTLNGWQRRPLWEKLIGSIAWVLERQQ